MAEAMPKRKVEEILECSICKNIPSEGRMMQCRNGHLACERCMGNETLISCAVCREPRDNKRIRNLSIEQLIEAVDMDVSCKHPNCCFKAAKTAIKTHERSCDKRIVECPDPKCPGQVPLNGLLEHMKVGNPVLYPELTVGTLTSNLSGVISSKGEITPERFQGNVDLGWYCKVHKFQGEIFASAFHRTNGIWYAYTYILADAEKAEKFRVKISIGNQNEAGMFFQAQGQVFPIDAKKVDILKARSGVLSFAQVGMAEQFFMDHQHEVGEHSFTRKRFQFSYEIIGESAQRVPMRMY